MSDTRAALQLPDFRRLLAAVALSTLASRALFVVIGYQVYQLSAELSGNDTGDPLVLGWLGLAEAIPALSLALFGGHFADRHDRRRIVLMTTTVATGCAAILAAVALHSEFYGLPVLYAAAFVTGVTRGFAEPAAFALETQIVPRSLFVAAATVQASVWQGCAIAGPALGGAALLLGRAPAYALIAVLFAASASAVWAMHAPPVPPAKETESIWRSIGIGVRYVFGDQVLVGSMALDLFAVLFGGAIALLPVFAKDVLHVGPVELGMLNAAPSVGSLAVMLWSTRYPPVRDAGFNLLLSVAAFGLSMIVFAFSKNIWLSLAALALSGAFDGISMVIRKAILRVISPEQMRGRVSAVNSIFIGASNEVGAFESGVAARLLGTVPSVWIGGVVTLIVVVAAGVLAPRLRTLNLRTAKPRE
jgi:MFS family permease